MKFLATRSLELKILVEAVDQKQAEAKAEAHFKELGREALRINPKATAKLDFYSNIVAVPAEVTEIELPEIKEELPKNDVSVDDIPF